MRLYLSSFRMGNHPGQLAALVGGAARTAVVIGNALDGLAPGVRRDGVERELTALAGLGFAATELDLRDYTGQAQRLRRELAAGLAWVRGGNVFMLRYALARSGGDEVFRDLLAADALVYGGYSAGPCVLAPSLRGLELVDDTGEVRRVYGAEPVWDGLGVLDEAFVPHYRSAGHPETDAMDRVVARYRAEGVAYRTLHDGQALVVHGGHNKIV
ncbi:MAG: Type 1 glutamine amidotransferase-like domain-containing protein [Streptosporangiaceae bacterium]